MSQNPSPALLAPPTAVDHARGADHGRITIVEYGDFECPTCRAAEPAVRMILESYPTDVRHIWRHFPLEAAHPHALLAAEAAECASAQGKFWEMHDLLLENQRHLTGHDLTRLAQQVGLDMARYKAELDDHIYLQRVREHLEGGREHHLRATPTFFVNGALVDVSFGFTALRDAVHAVAERVS